MLRAGDLHGLHGLSGIFFESGVTDVTVLQNDTKPHKINLTRRQYPVTLGW